MREPGFEFDAPPAYTRPYEKFPRHQDLSYLDRYEPNLWMRYDHETLQEGSWDKIWNTSDYKIAENVNELDAERVKTVWREDVYTPLISEKQQYEGKMTELLKRYNYKFYKGPEKKPLPGKLY